MSSCVRPDPTLPMTGLNVPIFYFKCKACGIEKKYILEPEEAKQERKCLEQGCGAEMFRTPRPPTSSVKETFDNGVMTKKVEQFKDAKELLKERSKLDLKNKY